MPASARPLLTPREVAARCNLNYRTVLKAIEAGELPAFRLCNRLRVDPEQMEAWIESSLTTPRRPVSPDRRSRRQRAFAPHSLKNLNQENP